jgi:hypothetical protein
MTTALLLATCSLLTTACSGGTSDTTPTKPEVPAGPGPAARLVIRTQPGGATVGQPLLVQPVVELQDARGAIATTSSAMVTIRVTDGATTTIAGQTAVAAVAGVVTFSGLSLTGSAGSKTFEFSTLGLESATSASIQLAPGAPKALILATAPSLSAMVTVPLAAQPVVQAVDIANNPTTFAATVTAAVDSGPGTIMNGASASTDGAGKAQFSGFTLGGSSGSVGQVRVRMTAPGVDPVVFRVGLTCFSQAIQAGATIASATSAGDCTFRDGTSLRAYTITRSQPVSHLRLSMSSSFRPSLYVRGPNTLGPWYWGRSAGSGSTALSLDLLTAAGMTAIHPGPALPGEVGPFSLQVEELSGDVSCLYTQVTGSLTTTQRLAPGDCGNTFYFNDYFYVGVTEGATLTATVTNAAFQPYVAIYRSANDQLLSFGSGSTSAATSHVNTGSAEVYYIRVASNVALSFGAYTLAINMSLPAGVKAAPVRMGSEHPGASVRPAGIAPVFNGFPPAAPLLR